MGLTPGLMQLIAQAAQQQGIPQGPPPAAAPTPDPSGGNPSFLPVLFSSGAPAMDTSSAPSPSINPGPGQVLPPTSPITADGSAALEQATLEASRAGKQWTGEQIARSRAAGDKAAALQETMARVPVPPMGKQWHVGKDQSLIKNLMNVLGMVGTATGPGRAIESAYYAPGIRRYQSEIGNLAEQIKTIQEQQKVEEQPIAATAGMVYHPLQAGAGLERALAMKARAAAYAQDVKNRFKVGMERVGIQKQLLPSEISRNQAQAILDTALAKVAPERIELGYSEQDLRANIASEVAQVKEDQQPVLRRFFNTVFGEQITPAPVTPGSTPPSRGPNPPPARRTRRVIDLTK